MTPIIMPLANKLMLLAMLDLSAINPVQRRHCADSSDGGYTQKDLLFMESSGLF
jgi:hypothetical protein